MEKVSGTLNAKDFANDASMEMSVVGNHNNFGFYIKCLKSKIYETKALLK